MSGAYQHLRGQPRHRRVDLVVGQPVVEQGHLGAEPPARQQHRDERRRGWQPQRRGAAGAESGRGEVRGLLVDQGAQGVPIDRCAEMQALLASGAASSDRSTQASGASACGGEEGGSEEGEKPVNTAPQK